MCKFISVVLIFSIIAQTVTTSVKANSLRTSASSKYLALPSVIDSKLDNAFFPCDSTNIDDLNYSIFKKNEAHHIIAGILHLGRYPFQLIDSLSKDRDILITEGIRGDISLFGIHVIYSIYSLIQKLLKKSRNVPVNQNEHEIEILKNKRDIFNLDIYYTHKPFLDYLIIFTFIAITYLCIQAIYFLYSFIIISNVTNVLQLALSHLLHPIIIFYVSVIFYESYKIILPGGNIISDFRNLVYAEKLNYLPTILQKRDLKTITIIGEGHRQGIIKYLESDSERTKAWERYTNNKYLRRAVIKQLDILKSMNIIKLNKVNGTLHETVIGSIAHIPGPKALIIAAQNDKNIHMKNLTSKVKQISTQKIDNNFTSAQVLSQSN